MGSACSSQVNVAQQDVLFQPITEVDGRVWKNKTPYVQQAAYGGMQAWRSYMEDRQALATACSDQVVIFGVFDGHGGAEVSEYLSKTLPRFVEKALEGVKDSQTRNANILSGISTEYLERKLSKAFCDCDEELRSMKPSSGSTACLALITEENVWVANTGDSRAVVSRKGFQAGLSM